MSELAQVVIVGRPNVGKSTLMNKILDRREAIVEDTPGVTRDRKTELAEWQGTEFLIVDTGGWLASGSALENKVSDQSAKAVADAAVVLFVVDSQVGLTEQDSQALSLVRALRCPVLLVANKVEGDGPRLEAWNFLSLGLGDPYVISAIHGHGVADLLDAVIDNIDIAQADDESEGSETEEKIYSVAIVGRPNVGKSTLFNHLIGDERSITHDMAGTTRDTIDTVVETRNGSVRFLDTAGLRRTSKISDDTEYYSAMRSLKSVDGADLCLLVLDATEGVTQQDQRLAERVDAAGCPIVIIVNKIDLVGTEQRLDIEEQISRRLGFLPHPTTHKIAATTGKGTRPILSSLRDAIGVYERRVPTQKVNQVIRLAQQAQPAPGGARVLYATQGATDPPTFTLFVNRKIGDPYLRYLEGQLRDAFEFENTPIKMRVRLRNE